MPNTVLTNLNAPGIVAKVAAKMLADKVQFVKGVDKEPYDTFNGVNGYQSGQTIQIAKPARFIMNSGADITAQIQDVVEEKQALTLSSQRNVALNFTSAEIATDFGLKQWMKRVVDPAMTTLANGIEGEVLTTVKNATYNIVGTPGSTVFDTDTMMSATQKLDENLTPMDDNRFALLNPFANRSAVNARKGLFQASDEIASQYKNGYIGQADGFTYIRNSLLPIQLNGTASGAHTVTTTSVTGATTLAVTGTGTQTITAGTVFTVAGVFAVHPITKATMPNLQQFVVTANATAVAGAYTLSVSPTIYGPTSGSLQNVSQLPTSTSAVTFLTGSASTSYVQNMTYHTSAVRFVSAPLVMPDGLDMAAQETADGITVRVIRDYLPLTDKMIMRLDVLYGVAVVRPEWITRVTA